jgi:hypothetical protein
MPQVTSTEAKTSASTEPTVFLSNLDNWNVDDEHLVYDVGRFLHPNAEIDKVECTPFMNQVRIDFARKALIADIGLMRSGVGAHQFLCEVYAKVGSHVSWRAFVVDLEEQQSSSSRLQVQPTHELMNLGESHHTLSDNERSLARQTRDTRPIGIYLGTIFQPDHGQCSKFTLYGGSRRL